MSTTYKIAEAEASPIACTLDPAAMGDRMDDWQAALAHVVDRQAIPGGVRLVLGANTPLGDLTALAAAEQGCCSFFSFALTLDGRGAALEVRAPEDAADLVTSLFGTAA